MPRESAVEIPVPLLGRLRDETLYSSFPEYGSSNAYAGTTVTGSTSNALGAWTELIASSVEAHMLLISVYGMFTTKADTRGLVDIGVGGAGVESTIIASLPAGFSNTTQALGFFYCVPVYIPAASRIVARLRSFIASDTVNIQVTAMTDSEHGFRRYLSSTVDTYGAVTASSRGTNLPTNDTYVELSAATTRPYRMLAMLPCGGTGTAYANATVTYTLGVGPAGSEVTVGTRSVTSNSTEYIYPTFTPLDWGLFYGPFPQGIRIACKQSTGVTYRDVIVLGIP